MRRVLSVMALEMSDNGNVSTLKYAPASKPYKSGCAQYDARRSVKGVGKAQLQAIVSNSKW